MEFRLLKPEEIDCRVGSINNKGLTLLLYKDARCDMTILDETVGQLNWQRRHVRDNANCIVSIYNDTTNTWVEKEDTGTESNTEAQKGLASDSFKRACTNWGIGRELYTSPFIWISNKDCSIITNERTGKLQCFDSFVVTDIEYDGRKIKTVTLVNTKNGKEFTFSHKKVEPKATEESVEDKPNDRLITKNELQNLQKQMEKKNVTAEQVLSRYKINALGEMTLKQYNKCLTDLEMTR